MDTSDERRFPWKELQPGQAFFLLCLDPDPVAVAGMRAAVAQEVYDSYCSIGLYNGKFGVLFGRLPVPRQVNNYIFCQ
jgi:hypothetical protein